MTTNIPLVARMIFVQEIINNENKENRFVDNSYYNTSLDSECEYCQNTSSWD